MGLLEGRVAVITGAARGMGYAMARRFSKEGARVVIIDIRGDAAEEAAKKIREAGGEAIAFQGDVTSRERMNEIVSEVLKTYDKIDILVNNVGIHDGRAFWEESEDLWNKLFKVNVLGIVIPSQVIVPHMMKRKYGKIINMSSKAAVVGEPGHTAYTATKGAVLAMTRAMAIELAPYNIKVNAICPGPTETDMLFSSTTEEQRRHMAQRSPLGRLAKPEDIANTALFLASDESDYITGQAIVVDGGMTVAAIERV